MKPEAASDHYRLRAGQDDITATLAVFGSETHLASDTQEYMGKEWSDNASKTGVENSDLYPKESLPWPSDRISILKLIPSRSTTWKEEWSSRVTPLFR